MFVFGRIGAGFGVQPPGGITAPTLTVTDPLMVPASVNYAVTGGSSSAANTLYQASWNGVPGSLAWTPFATFTGNQLAAGVPCAPGFYWWYVGAASGMANAVSNMIYQPILDKATQAIQTQCRAAIVLRLKSLNLQNIGVKVYDVPNIKELSYQMPCCVVFSDPARPATRVLTNTNRDDVTYSFQVAFQVADNFGLNSPRALYEQWLEKGTDAFSFTRLTGVPRDTTTEIDIAVPADPNNIPEFYNTCAVVFVVKCTCRVPRGFHA